MKKIQIALKPYLDKITAHCSALSYKELTDVIISLAKDVPTSDRVKFLEKIESSLPGHTLYIYTWEPSRSEFLDEIEALM